MIKKKPWWEIIFLKEKKHVSFLLSLGKFQKIKELLPYKQDGYSNEVFIYAKPIWAIEKWGNIVFTNMQFELTHFEANFKSIVRSWIIWLEYKY